MFKVYSVAVVGLGGIKLVMTVQDEWFNVQTLEPEHKLHCLITGCSRIGGCAEAMDENSDYVNKPYLCNHCCFTKQTQTLKA